MISESRINELAPDHRQLAALLHRGEVFAFPLQVVREVVPMSELLTPVCSADCVQGFILLRGTQVPVMDLSTVMNYGHEVDSSSAVVAILRYQDCLLGLIIDDVFDVLRVDAAAFSKIVFDHGDSGCQLIVGTYTLEPAVDITEGKVRSVTLLDEEALFSIPGVPLTRVEPLPVQIGLAEHQVGRKDDDRSLPEAKETAVSESTANEITAIDGSEQVVCDSGLSAELARGVEKTARAEATPEQSVKDSAESRPPPVYSPHILVVRIRQHYFAIQAEFVQTTMADYTLEIAPVDNEMYLGEIRFQNHSIAVADWSQLFWQYDGGRTLDITRRPLLVYRMAQGMVGLVVDEVLDVLPTPAVELLPLASGSLPGGDLIRGVLPLERLYKDGKENIDSDFVMLFDDQRIQATESLVRLASMDRELPVPKIGAGSAGNSSGRHTSSVVGDLSDTGKGSQELNLQQMLIVDAGVEVCCQIRDVVEIFKLGKHQRIVMPGTPLCGLATVRGRAISVYQLAGLIGQSSEQTEGEVLVVKSGSGWVGFLVAGLREILYAQWQRQVDVPALARPNGVDYGQYKACWSLCGLQTSEGLKTTPSLNLGKLAEVYTNIFPAVAFAPEQTSGSDC